MLSDLKSAYRLRFEGSEGYRNAIWQILCNDFFADRIGPHAKVLDLGAGWGEFINHVNAGERWAMDLNPDTRSHLAPGIRFLHQDCSQRWPLDDASLDVVFTSNFLEHLPSKESIETTISEAFRCLKRGGIIICLGPNIKHLPGAYWDFWDHHVPITDVSLAELLKITRFEIEECIARFLPYTMSSGSNPPLIFVKLYLKFPVIWPLFGKQFLVIARKHLT